MLSYVHCNSSPNIIRNLKIEPTEMVYKLHVARMEQSKMHKEF